MEKHTKTIIIVTTILLAAITAVIIGMVVIQATPANRLKRQLRLAQKYLNELNYEQAVLAYKEAISIDPKCEQAYFAIVEIYIKTNEEDKAVAILEQAQVNIQTDALSARLDEVRKQAAAAKEARQEGGSAGQNNGQNGNPETATAQSPTQLQPTTAQPKAATQVLTEASTEIPTQPETEIQTEPQTTAEPQTKAPTEPQTQVLVQAEPEPQPPASGIIPANAGDIITFGTYEQDNNTGNGAEPIEWLVLDNQGDRMLVISRYGLDCRKYNETYTAVTWETCSLRSWLNSEFYNTAFSDSEKASIRTTTINNTDNAGYNTGGGSATTDNVFCLSIDEAKAYFGADDGNGQNPARAVKVTAHAVVRGAYADTSAQWYGGNCWWWLRSPGYQQGNAAYVLSHGNVSGAGDYVNSDHYAIRPALWIGF